MLSFNTSTKNVSYTFDHLLHYEYQYAEGKEMEERFFLTNSKDNSYFADLRIVNHDSIEIRFLHHDKIMGFYKIQAKDIYEKDRFEMFCKNLSSAKNYFKFRTKEYAYHHFKDTLLKSYPGEFYVFKHKSPGIEKNLNLVRSWYRQKKGTENHMPLLTHPTAYAEWKKEKNMGNGISDLRFKEYLDEPIEREIFKLKNIIPVSKIFFYNSRCELDSQKKEIYTKFYKVEPH
ncbi:hypothetical protein DHD80_04110 [Gramella sp. AN32]|nr:hypothetical protein [Gramella sp. AN32]